MTLLELTDVSRRLRDGARELIVLDGVNFDVHAGELVSVYGERYSGKSTFVKLAAGLEVAEAGTVCFDGEDLARLSIDGRARLRRRGGLAVAICDSGPLSSSQPVVEYVALPLTGDGLTLGESEGLARPVLERLGASALSHLRVDQLSLSDRLRVELARALAREPRLLLVDEPGVLPGPSERRELLRLLRACSESGIAVVIASSDMDMLRGMGRFLTLTDGRLRSTDSRRRVIQFPGARAAGGAGRSQ
jgi:predicted ABC-type transport system involved in lysophospholipase L1 biosynthesis ATPase subunit